MRVWAFRDGPGGIMPGEILVLDSRKESILCEFGPEDLQTVHQVPAGIRFGIAPDELASELNSLFAVVQKHYPPALETALTPAQRIADGLLKLQKLVQEKGDSVPSRSTGTMIKVEIREALALFHLAGLGRPARPVDDEGGSPP